MKHLPSLPKRKPLRFVMIIISMFSLACVFCCSVVINTHYPQDTYAPAIFPDTEIVYTVYKGLGFVNSDGSLFSNLDFAVKIVGDRLSGYSGRIAQPVITANDQVIARIYPADFFNVRPYYLALWRTNAPPIVCKQWGEQRTLLLSSDQRHVFIQTEQGLELYTLESCGTDDPPVKVYENVFGIPSPNLQYVAYVKHTGEWDDKRFIVVRELSSSVEFVVGEGDYPAWSRDSQWIAYTGEDGIYIVRVIKGTKPRRLILYLNPSGTAHLAYRVVDDIWPPEVAWSPDGKWLVYHKLAIADYVHAIAPSDYAIYKLNIETGEEIKIIDGGMYPYWRWPAEQPGE
jgi:hypothetical protein